MKLAFATYDSSQDVGGVSTWLRRLLPRLQAHGFDVEAHVLCFEHGPGVNCAWFRAQGIPFRWSPWPLETRAAVRTCLRFIAESEPDVYVPNCILPAYFAAKYARRSGIATVGVLHSDDPFYHGIIAECIDGPPSSRLSAVVPVSEYLEAIVRPIANRHDLPVCRIGCGVPVPPVQATAATDRFRLVYVGKLEEEQKRISEVARALCAAVHKHSNVDAWIVGEGRARASVEEIVRIGSPGGDRVRLLGRVESDAIYDILKQCHALVLLSDYEGLPVCILEAMAAGVVPICLETRSGIGEAIMSGENGLIVRDRDRDFLSAVQSLSTSPALWNRLSAAARETAVNRFSIESGTARWIEFLGTVAPAPTNRPPFRTPRWIRLPAANPNFGPTDVRSPLAKRIWAATRIYLGAQRQKIFRPARLSR